MNAITAEQPLETVAKGLCDMARVVRWLAETIAAKERELEGCSIEYGDVSEETRTMLQADFFEHLKDGAR